MFNNPFREGEAANRNKRQQLDHLLRVTAPHERVILAGIGLVLVAAAIWPILGNVERSVTLDGLLLLSGDGREAVSNDRRQRVDVLVAMSRRPDSLAPPIRAGMRAEVELELPGGEMRRMDGEVTRISPGALPGWLVAQPSTVARSLSRIELSLKGAEDLVLEDGAPCRVRVVLGQQAPAALFSAVSA